MGGTTVKTTLKTTLMAVLAIFVMVLLSTCELFSVGLGSKVDITTPVVSITSHVSASYVSGSFVLSGSAFDDVEVKAVEVIRSGQLLTTATVNGSSWSATIDSSNLADGESQFIVRASDSSGKRAETSVLLYVDNNAPTVLVKTPVAYEPIDAVYNTRIQFRAYTYDRSPVDRVELVLYDQSGTEIIRKNALNIDGWMISIERGVDVPDIEWEALDGQDLSYEFLAHDRAGNVSSWFYHAADLPAGFSSVEDLGPADQSPTVALAVLAARFDGAARLAGVSIDFDSDKPVFSISVPSDGAVLGSGSGAIGTVLDDDAVVPTSIRATVRLLPGGPSYALAAIITGNSAAGAQAYNFQIPLTTTGIPVSSGGTALPDGEYEIIFLADDISTPPVVGESDPLVFIIDKAVPSIQGIFPEPGGYIAVDTNVAVSAIVTDDNALSVVRMSIDGGINWLPASKSVDPVDPDRWAAVINVASSTIPPVNVMFEATDTTGKTARFTAQYQIDAIAPTIEILAPDLSQPVNGRIRLRTFVVDNNSIDSVRLKVGASGAWQDYASRDVVIDTTGFTDPSTVPFWVEARDSAGYEATCSGSFDVDQSSDIPVSGFRNLDDTATVPLMAGNNLFVSGPVITGNAEDDDGIAVGGITYQINGGAWLPASIQGASRFRSFSVDLSTLTEGIRSITVRTTDDFSVKEGSPAATVDIGPVWFAVDYAAPVITVDGSWGAGVYKTAAGFEITGSASDGNGIATLSASGAGSLVAGGAAGDTSRTWSVPVAAPVQGINTVTITATDGVGKTSTQEVKFFYDSEVPDLSVDNLADGSAISSASYTINGRVNDLSGIAAIEFSINDSPAWDSWATVSSVSQSWSHLVTGLTEGAGQQIRFRARDNAGNVATTAVIGFALDLNPPTLTSNKASFDNTFQSSDFTLSGTTSDANGIKKLEISYDAGSNYSVITTTPAATTDPTVISWSQTVAVAANGADDGLKAIRIRATDQYDKETVIPLAVRFDSSAPTFGLNNLVDNQVLTALSYPAMGTWTDNGGSGTLGGSAKIQWSLTDSANDGDWTSFTATASAWNGTVVFPGQTLAQSLFIRAMDALGNKSAPAMLILKVDTELPTSTILHDGSADWVSAVYKTSSFLLSGVAADSLALGSVAVSGAGVVPANLNFNAGTGVWDIQITPPADGTYTYTITVTDGAGRQTQYNRTIGYDTSAPTLDLNTDLSPWQRSTAVSISGFAADVGSGLKAIQYSLDGTNWTTFNTTSPWTGTVDIPAGASNALRLRAMDNAGLTSAIISRTVKVDAVAPTFTIDQAPFVQTKAAVLLSGELEDDLALHSVTPLTIVRKKNGIVQTQGVATYPTGTTWAYTQNANPDHSDDGLWELTFTAMDSSGLTTVETRSFRIDTTVPSLTVSSPAVNQSSDTSSFSISGSASDVGGTGFDGIDDVEYSLNGTDWTALTLTGTSWGTTISLGTTQGARTLYLRSTDAVGNTATQTVNFFYDNAPPTVTETGVGAATFYTKADIALSGILFDTNDVANILVTYVKSGDPTVHTVLNQAKSGSNTNVPWSVSVDVDTDGEADGDTSGLTDGTYTFTITATDAAFKAAVVTRTVVVDATAPELPVIASSPADYVTNSLAVNGTALDATSGLAVVRYSINTLPTAITGTLNGGAEWYGTINVSAIAEGSYLLTVWTEDRVGNISASASHAFRVDRNPPELMVAGLAAGSTYFSNINVSLTGNADDANGIAAVQVTWTRAGGGSGTLLDLDTGDPELAGLPSSYAWSTLLSEALGDGSYTVTFDIADGVGKHTTAVRAIVIDNMVPALSLGSVTPIVDPDYDGDNLLIGGKINGTTVLRGTAGDNTQLKSLGWNRAPTRLQAESGPFTAVTGNLASWIINYDTLDAADNDPLDRVFLLRAEDQAGNVTYREIILNIDQETDKPVITVSSPTAGGYVGAGHTVVGTASDDDGIDVNTLRIRWYNGTAWSGWEPVPAGNITGPATAKSFTYVLPDLGEDGVKQIELEVYDIIGTNNAITGEPIQLTGLTLTLDTANPLPVFTIPAADELIYGTAFTVEGTVFDAGLSSLHISLNGGNRTLLLSGGSGTQGWSFNLAGLFGPLANGRHTLTLEAVDRVGRVASIQLYFYKDTVGPSLSFLNLIIAASPATALVTPDTIRGTAADTYSALSPNFQYRFDSDVPGDWRSSTFSGANWTVPVPSELVEGLRTITVRASDALNNLTTSVPVAFRLDRNPPTVNFTPPVISLYSGDFTLSGTVTDTNDVEKVEYYVNDVLIDTGMIPPGTAVLPAAAAWSHTVDTSAQVDGNYTVKIVATDRVGRTNQRTFSYQLDKTPPIATLGGIAPIVGGTTLNGSVVISSTGSDDNGLAASNPLQWAVTDPSVVTGAIAGYSFGAGDVAWTPLSTAFDTTIQPIWEDATLRIWVRAQDRAGNYGYTYVDRMIDQDSDRPVVSLNNIDVATLSTLKLSRTIYGQVNDDDGTVNQFQVSLDGSVWTTRTVSGGAWTYDIPLGQDDGNLSLYFRITDSVGTVFTTGAADPFKPPRVFRGDGADPLYQDGAVAFRLDTKVPEIDSNLVLDRIEPYFDGVGDLTPIPFIANMAIGGVQNKFVMQVRARDANGLAGVKLLVPGLVDPLLAAKAGDAEGYEVWQLPQLDTSILADGLITLQIDVTDTSGLTTTLTRGIRIDNTAPTLINQTPLTSEILTGNVIVRGLAEDTGSGLEKVQYKVGYNHNDLDWLDIPGNQTAWEIDFSAGNRINNYAGREILAINAGDDLFTLPAHGFADGQRVWLGAVEMPAGLSHLEDYYITDATLDTFRLTTTPGIGMVDFSTEGSAVRISRFAKSSLNDGVWQLPMFFRVMDKAGNIAENTVIDYVLQIDPSGDIPRVTIVYPDPLASNRTLGGNIRIFGSAEDNIAVHAVYMQITAEVDGSDIPVFSAANSYDGIDWYVDGQGKLISGTSSWNYTINTTGEFDPLLPGETKTIWFRVRARDNDSNFSPWTAPQRIDVDKGVPLIGSSEPLRLVKRTGDLHDGAIIAELVYQADVWLRGVWYLVGSIEDESGINSISVTTVSTASTTISGNLGTLNWFESTGKPVPEAPADNYRMNIPISNAGTNGRVGFVISANDASTPSLSTQMTMSIQGDNAKPTVTAGEHPYTGNQPVVQSNQSYQLASSLVEEGSGFSHVAFYLIRRGATAAQDRVYMPMGSNLHSLLTGLVQVDGTDGAFYLDYALVARPTTRSAQHLDFSSNPFVRRGSIIRINGIDRLITAVSGDTIEWADEVDLSVSSLAVAYAMIVNNLTIETPQYDGSGNQIGITNDDGDGMVETVERLGGRYNWTCLIDSRNIPDGPIEIHWVSYDKAGNAAHRTVNTMIANNRPRIASVTLGTDLNGNDNVESGEKTNTYSTLVNSIPQSMVNLLSSAFRARGRTSVDIEIVGGNGRLDYTLSRGAGALGPLTLLRPDEGAVQTIELAGTEAILGTDGPEIFNIVIWDSTEETTRGVNSLSASLSVPMEVELNDSMPPTAAIRPFYWNGASANSLYNNATANGHIDIASIVDGDDPDISGGVRFRGFARDDQRINAIYAYIGNGTDDTSAFEFTGHGGVALVSDGLTYYPIAIYSNGSWTTAGNYALDGWLAGIAGNSIDQNGHVIDWTLDLNSARIPGGAALNRVFRILVVDKSDSNVNGSTAITSVFSGTGTRTVTTLTDAALSGQAVEAGMPIVLGSGEEAYATRVKAFDSSLGIITFLADDIPISKTGYVIYRYDHNNPLYQTDVVPFITDIQRKLPFTNRLGLNGQEGQYPLFQGQTGVVLSGFNLPASASGLPANTLTIGGTDHTAAITAAQPEGTALTITVPPALAPGAGVVVIRTNGVASVNHLNTNTLPYNTEGSFNDDRVVYIDNVAPRIHIAPFGRRYTTGSDDSVKTLATITPDRYNENIAMSGNDRLGHIEYAEHSNYSEIPVSISGVTISSTAHGLADGQFVQFRFDTAPTIEGVPIDDMTPFYLRDRADNTFSVSATAGGVAVSFDGDGTSVRVVDPEVSGTVILRGKVWDNQRIRRVTAVIPGFDGTSGNDPFTGLPTVSGGEFTVYSSVMSSGVPVGTFHVDTGWSFALDGMEYKLDGDARAGLGHMFNWSFTWDSSLITTVAAEDVRITFKVYDYNDTPLAHEMSQNVDVVPYISAIANPLFQGLSADVLRSSTGKYSIETHTSRVFNVSGFNLGGTLYAPAARVSTAPITTPSGLAPATSFVNSNSITVSKNLTRSGYLTVFVNGVPSVNNLGNRDKAYQSEKDPTKIYSEQWQDQRYLWVWAVTQVLPAVTNQTFYYPDMVMDGIQPLFSYADDNSGRTRRTTGDTTWAAKSGLYFSRQTQMTFAGGQYYMLTVEDSFSDASSGGFFYVNRDTANNATMLNPSNGLIEIQAIDYISRQMNRFRCPKLIGATNAVDAARADLWIAYYDSHPALRRIVFTSMIATGNNTTRAGYTQPAATGRATPVVELPFAGVGAGHSQYYELVRYGANSFAVVYFDELQSVLRMAYTTTATTGENVADTGATWTTITLDASPFSGSHVSAVSDGTYIYVAYYDAGNANLNTLRVNHGTMEVSAPVVVDAYLSAGTWTRMGLMDFDGAGGTYDTVPVISYYAESFNGTNKPIKMAFPTSAVNFVTSGVLPTGTREAPSDAWEVLTIPAASAPKGGMEQFNRTMISSYSNNGMNLPVVAYLADRIEYAKLQPNN